MQNSIRNFIVDNPIVNMNKPINKKNSTILKELLEIVKECQNYYGSKSELATENDPRIRNLCINWEAVFFHGIKPNTLLLKNITDLIGSAGNSVGGGSSGGGGGGGGYGSGGFGSTQNFWGFAIKQLTGHEQHRFDTLKNVWTEYGKSRAFIRASLNERTLERYILMWLNEPSLRNFYEPWSMLCDGEVTNLLPSIASGLTSILFAITVDDSTLNFLADNKKSNGPELVIAVPHPISRSSTAKSNGKAKLQIINFEDDQINSETQQPSNSAASNKSEMANVSIQSSSKLETFDKICVVEEEIPVSVIKSIEPMIKDIESVESVNEDQEDSNLSDCDESESLNLFTKTPTLEDVSNLNNSNTITKQTIEKSISIASSKSSLLESSIGGGDYDNYGNNASTLLHSGAAAASSIVNETSDNSITGNETVILKNQLQRMVDKCSYLEKRVAELSLENHRLKGLNSFSNYDCNFFVNIPRAFLQNDKKSFYAYEVHIIPANGGDEWLIIRRYSEFYKLHKDIKKTGFGTKALDFPPKKSFGNMDEEFIEQRRQHLQAYLRNLFIMSPDIMACTNRKKLQLVFPFFKR